MTSRVVSRMDCQVLGEAGRKLAFHEEFQFYKMKEFGEWLVVMVVQDCGCT